MEGTDGKTSSGHFYKINTAEFYDNKLLELMVREGNDRYLRGDTGRKVRKIFGEIAKAAAHHRPVKRCKCNNIFNINPLMSKGVGCHPPLQQVFPVFLRNEKRFYSKLNFSMKKFFRLGQLSWPKIRQMKGADH